MSASSTSSEFRKVGKVAESGKGQSYKIGSADATARRHYKAAGSEVAKGEKLDEKTMKKMAKDGNLFVFLNPGHFQDSMGVAGELRDVIAEFGGKFDSDAKAREFIIENSYIPLFSEKTKKVAVRKARAPTRLRIHFARSSRAQ